jgi:peroxiredoxin Q/BCP
MTLIRCAGMLAPAIALATVAFAQPDSRQPGSQPPPATNSSQGSPQYHAHATGQVVIGEQAPDFVLDASSGKSIKLSSLRGHWVLLAFSDRKEALAPLRDVCGALDSAGVTLVGVCGEKAYNLEVYARKVSLPYLLLADVSREISQLYGLYDGQERAVLPGYLLLTPEGDVRMTLLGQRLPPSDLERLVLYVIGQT